MRNKENAIKQAKKTMENKKLILEFIKMNGDSKTSEIAERIQLSESRTRAILGELVAEGKISTSGETKRKTYFLMK